MAESAKKYKVGVIGCGRISVLHFDALKNLPQTEAVACADVKKERADEAAAKYGVKAYYTYEEMLEKEKLDAVHICLPHYLHTEAACRAFEKGVGVLTEKPMDVTYEKAEYAVREAKKRGVPFGVVFQCRFNDSVQLVRQALDAGKLGKILSARSVLTWHRPDEYYAESDWKGTWDKEGGGVVIDQAIHSVDLVRWLVGGEAVSVSCSMANRGHGAVAVEDSAEGLVTFDNGVRYGFYCMNNYDCDEPIEIRLYCEKGKVTLSYDDAVIRYADGRTEEAHSGDATQSGKGQTYWSYGHARLINNFYNAFAGVEPLYVTAEEGLKTQRLISMIYKEGKPQ